MLSTILEILNIMLITILEILNVDHNIGNIKVHFSVSVFKEVFWLQARLLGKVH